MGLPLLRELPRFLHRDLEVARGAREPDLLQVAVCRRSEGDTPGCARDAVLDVPGHALADRRPEAATFEDAGRGREAGDRLEHAAACRIAGVRGARIAVVAGDLRVRTGPGRRIARPGEVADVLRRADDRGRGAASRLARVGRAGIAVGLARGPVHPGGRLAAAVGLVADAVVALIGEERAVAGDTAAHARGADVVDGAEGAVVAGGAVGCVGRGAETRGGVADPRALRIGLADHRIASGARSRLAGVGLGAGIPIVAGRAVRLARGGADAGRRVAGAGVVALIERGADDGVRPDAGAGLAGVGLGAGIAVGAGGAVRRGRVGAGPVGRVTNTSVVALIEGGADDGVPALADTCPAGVGLGASVAVVAGAAVRRGRVGAGAVGRVTNAGVVALIERAADDGVRARAHARLAGVGLRTGVAVRAGRPVGLLGIRARAGLRIAGAGVVALSEGGADDGVRPDAGAGLAGVALGAGVAVAAGRPVGLARIGARAGLRVTAPGVVTLIERGADDGSRADAGAG